MVSSPPQPGVAVSDVFAGGNKTHLSSDSSHAGFDAHAAGHDDPFWNVIRLLVFLLVSAESTSVKGLLRVLTTINWTRHNGAGDMGKREGCEPLQAPRPCAHFRRNAILCVCLRQQLHLCRTKTRQ